MADSLYAAGRWQTDLKGWTLFGGLKVRVRTNCKARLMHYTTPVIASSLGGEPSALGIV